MIVRSAFKCLTCSQAHTVRIGLGQEDYQDHRFSCTVCHEPMAIAVHLDFANAGWRLEALENTEPCAEVVGSPIVNIDANFTIPKPHHHTDLVFPRHQQMQDMMAVAEKAGHIRGLTSIRGTRQQRPFRRPDFLGEWKLLKKAWSLRRNGHEKLSDRKMGEASAQFYADDPLKNFDDWLWRFLLNLSQPLFFSHFKEAFACIQPLLTRVEFKPFEKAFDALSEERGARNFDLIRAYFAAYSDFSQVLFLVSKDVSIPADHVASTVNFDSTCMFYGNAFEAFSSSVDILAYLNNLIEGRSFDTFKTMTRDKYMTLDRASRCGSFSANPAFTALCREFDNQLRNASHHGGLIFDATSQMISYRAGKGGTGQRQELSYLTYLSRSTKLFLQAVTLIQIEIMLCHLTGRSAPY